MLYTIIVGRFYCRQPSRRRPVAIFISQSDIYSLKMYPSYKPTAPPHRIYPLGYRLI